MFNLVKWTDYKKYFNDVELPDIEPKWFQRRQSLAIRIIYNWMIIKNFWPKLESQYVYYIANYPDVAEAILSAVCEEINFLQNSFSSGTSTTNPSSGYSVGGYSESGNSKDISDAQKQIYEEPCLESQAWLHALDNWVPVAVWDLEDQNVIDWSHAIVSYLDIDKIWMEYPENTTLLTNFIKLNDGRIFSSNSIDIAPNLLPIYLPRNYLNGAPIVQSLKVTGESPTSVKMEKTIVNSNDGQNPVTSNVYLNVVGGLTYSFLENGNNLFITLDGHQMNGDKYAIKETDFVTPITLDNKGITQADITNISFPCDVLERIWNITHDSELGNWSDYLPTNDTEHYLKVYFDFGCVTRISYPFSGSNSLFMEDGIYVGQTQNNNIVPQFTYGIYKDADNKLWNNGFVQNQKLTLYTNVQGEIANIGRIEKWKRASLPVNTGVTLNSSWKITDIIGNSLQFINDGTTSSPTFIFANPQTNESVDLLLSTEQVNSMFTFENINMTDITQFLLEWDDETKMYNHHIKVSHHIFESGQIVRMSFDIINNNQNPFTFATLTMDILNTATNIVIDWQGYSNATFVSFKSVSSNSLTINVFSPNDPDFTSFTFDAFDGDTVIFKKSNIYVKIDVSWDGNIQNWHLQVERDPDIDNSTLTLIRNDVVENGTSLSVNNVPTDVSWIDKLGQYLHTISFRTEYCESPDAHVDFDNDKITFSLVTTNSMSITYQQFLNSYEEPSSQPPYPFTFVSGMVSVDGTPIDLSTDTPYSDWMIRFWKEDSNHTIFRTKLEHPGYGLINIDWYWNYNGTGVYDWSDVVTPI